MELEQMRVENSDRKELQQPDRGYHWAQGQRKIHDAGRQPENG